MFHAIEIKTEYLGHLFTRRKKSIVVYNDKDFQVGDGIHFQEIAAHPTVGIDSPWMITHVHMGFGMLKDYVVLSGEWQEDQ